MANLLRLVALVICGFCGLPAWAVVPTYTSFAFPTTGWGAAGPALSSADAACSWALTNRASKDGYNVYKVVNTSQCQFGIGSNYFSSLFQLATALACPANSTKAQSGSGCVCNTGYAEENGACTETDTPDKRCAGDFNLSGFALGSGKLLDSQVLSGEVPSGDMCWPYDTPSSGCTVRFVQDKVVTMPGGTKQTYGRIGMYQGPAGATQGKACAVPAATSGDGTTVEENCSKAGYASSESSPGGRVCLDPPKCPGGFGGEVNGVEVCVKDDGANVVKSEKKTEIKKPDGSTETVTEKISCQGKTCTTEKTSINTPAGGGSSTTNVTNVSQPKEDYCKNNASSAQCNSSGNGEKDGKGGSFGGSCDAGFACEGDALQCAVAREQYKRSCQMFETPSGESKLYDAAVAKGRDADVTANLPGNKSFDVSGGVQSSDLLGGARCVPNLNITVWGRSVSLPLSDICPALGYMGWVLVAVSGLVAFRIVSGTSKDD